ncbi:MAG: sugar transferase [Desulfomonilaceae bacterium]|nr:sugar transferase [Desulfomonilaceae bacterium]
MKSTTKTIKRLFDLTIAVLALVACGPLLALISMAIIVTDGFPSLFRSRRAGLGGRPFTALKFRTMTNKQGADGALLPDSDRITRLGRFLRRTSMDELPQLINVVKGDMSIVGPRPLPVEYLNRYTREQNRRHEVKPGLTGWTQINYAREEKPWEKKFEQDLWYVQHWSLGLDTKIVFRTLGALWIRYKSRPEGFTTSQELRQLPKKGTGS